MYKSHTWAMTLKENLLGLVDAYAVVRGLSRARVSTLVFGDGTKVGKLLAGADITTSRYESAVRWFHENWPDDLPWPSDVPRPSVPPGRPPANFAGAERVSAPASSGEGA